MDDDDDNDDEEEDDDNEDEDEDDDEDDDDDNDNDNDNDADAAEDDDDDDDDDDADDDERKMMKWMLRRRRRKMMMWRGRVLRRKTDPKTRRHTLCEEPAQSKCTWTFDRSHFVWKFPGKMPDPNPGDIVSCKPAQSKCTWTFEEPFRVEIYRKNAGPARHVLCEPAQSKRTILDPDSRVSILREPAQSKCTWTFHKSHFVWNFTGKMRHAPATTSIKHRALTLTVRTPSLWPHCLGKHAYTNRTAWHDDGVYKV